MPGQLLPLRLLGACSGLLGSPRSISILSRAFPLKLKYAGLCRRQRPRLHNCGAGAAGIRAFSARSAGSTGGGLRDSRRGDFRSGSDAAGQGRSLVQDEAELSDWIGGLKMDPFLFGPGSESDDVVGYARGKTTGRERGRGRESRDGDKGRVRDGRNSFRVGLGSESDDAGEFARCRASSRERGRGRESRDGEKGRVRDGRNSFRVGLGSESDDAGEFARRRASSRERGRGRESRDGDKGRVRDGRNSFRVGLGSESDDAGEFARCRASSRERDRGRDGNTVRISDRRERGMETPPSRRGYGMPSNRERDGGSENFNSISDRRMTRGSDRPPRGSRRSQLRVMASERDLDEGKDDLDFGSRKRERRGMGGRSSSSLLAKRGRQDSDSSLLRTGGGRVSFEISDEEENVDDDGDDGAVSGSEDGSFGKVERREEMVVPDAHDRMGLYQEEDAPTRPSTSEEAVSYLSQTRFDQCSLSPLSLKGIKAAGYERMTMVQEATLPVILKGKDVLAKAKTGTGKTVAFLLPAIEKITKLPLVDRDQKRPPINVLVVCPTRELANQAAKEANTLLKFHPSIGVQVVIGGTRLALEQKNMQANPCQILVATPGRLRDHIENTPGFATQLKGVKVLVLDEADHLLDMGFRKDIENIIAAVPNQRQTLLFSATVPDEVRQVCHMALKRDHEFINTVEEGSEETHPQVEQMLLVAPLEKHFSMLYGILTDHISENVDYKVLVFCTTAMVTKLIADLLSELNLNVREIHSRKPQSYRTRVSDEFRKSKGLILVTSDVSARGVDYPDVTLVIQVGVPADREQYIHRLGRTGRKGKEGKGILLLAPWEEFFLSSIKDLPLSKAPVPLMDPDMRKKVERALAHVEMKNKESAYQSWLGYYNSNKSIGRDKSRLVALANEFSRSMGLDNPPAIPKLVLGKMGLRNVPGLRAK